MSFKPYIIGLCIFELIISKDIKQDRNTLYNRNKRSKQGVQTREDYLEEKKSRKEDKLHQLQVAMQKHPQAKGKDLAVILGVTPAYITKLKRLLKN